MAQWLKVHSVLAEDLRSLSTTQFGITIYITPAPGNTSPLTSLHTHTRLKPLKYAICIWRFKPLVKIEHICIFLTETPGLALSL